MSRKPPAESIPTREVFELPTMKIIFFVLAISLVAGYFLYEFQEEVDPEPATPVPSRLILDGRSGPKTLLRVRLERSLSDGIIARGRDDLAESEGSFFITAHPRQATAVTNEEFQFYARLIGAYEYRGTRVRAYTFVSEPEDAQPTAPRN